MIPSGTNVPRPCPGCPIQHCPAWIHKIWFKNYKRLLGKTRPLPPRDSRTDLRDLRGPQPPLRPLWSIPRSWPAWAPPGCPWYPNIQVCLWASIGPRLRKMGRLQLLAGSLRVLGPMVNPQCLARFVVKLWLIPAAFTVTGKSIMEKNLINVLSVEGDLSKGKIFGDLYNFIKFWTVWVKIPFRQFWTISDNLSNFEYFIGILSSFGKYWSFLCRFRCISLFFTDS